MKVRTHFNMAKLALRHMNGNDKKDKYSLFNRISLYVGSMVPDLNFIQIAIHPHFYKQSSNYVFYMISKIKKRKKVDMIFMFKLGIVMHYLNDFCCYVHRSGSIGNVNEHVTYERRMNKYLILNKETIYKKLKVVQVKNQINDISLEIKETLKKYYRANPSYILDINNSIIMNILVFNYALSYVSVDENKDVCRLDSKVQLIQI